MKKFFLSSIVLLLLSFSFTFAEEEGVQKKTVQLSLAVKQLLQIPEYNGIKTIIESCASSNKNSVIQSACASLIEEWDTLLQQATVPTSANHEEYYKDVVSLLAKGEKLEELNYTPFFEGLSRTIYFSEDSGTSLTQFPNYRIGEYYLILCGAGGGTASTHGNTCKLAGSELGLYAFWENTYHYYGFLMAKQGDEHWTIAGATSNTTPKFMFINNKKLYAITVSSDGAGSGEGTLSVLQLSSDGKREPYQCYFYNVDVCANNDYNCFPKGYEKMDKLPLSSCEYYNQIEY